MGTNCVYCGKKRENKVSFHKFPLNDPTLLKKWLENMNLGPQFKPTASMKLCSDHFAQEFFNRVDSEEVLRYNSVPTIFNHYKSSCVYCQEKKGYEQKRTFHGFPMEKPLLLRNWITAMNLPNFTPTKQSFLCSDHFLENAYRANKIDQYKRLKPNAVPSLFQPLSKNGDKRKTCLQSEQSAKKLRRNDTYSSSDSTSKKEYSENIIPDNNNSISAVIHPTRYSAIQETSGHFEEVQIKDEPMAADPNDCRLYQQLLIPIKTEPDNSEYCSGSDPTNSGNKKNIHSNLFDKDHFVNTNKESSDSSKNEISVNDDIVKTEQIPMFESVFVKAEPFDEDL